MVDWYGTSSLTRIWSPSLAATPQALLGTCVVADSSVALPASLVLTFYNSEGLSGWDTSSCTDMSSMFQQASSFQADLSAWKTGRVATMEGMFQIMANFNSNLALWDVSRVVSTSFMLYVRLFCPLKRPLPIELGKPLTLPSCSLLQPRKRSIVRPVYLAVVLFPWVAFSHRSFCCSNQDISNWNLASATNMDRMFTRTWRSPVVLSQSACSPIARSTGARAFNQNLCAWGGRVDSPVLVDIFLESGCDDTSSPNENDLLAGPWCQVCT